MYIKLMKLMYSTFHSKGNKMAKYSTTVKGHYNYSTLVDAKFKILPNYC